MHSVSLKQGVTLVVTSCRRFDLLRHTLETFYRHNDTPLAAAIVIEDSDDEGVREVTDAFAGHGLKLVINGRSLGQHASVDRAYAMVDTEYVFHCEDDWEFGRAGIISESLSILQADPGILMVLAREPMSKYMRSLRRRSVDGASYRLMKPAFHHKWYGFSFNPGLRRLVDYKALPGGYAAFPSEVAISLHYKAEGRSMAVLERAAVRHLGDDRSTSTRLPRWRRPYNELVEKPLYSSRRRLAHYARLIGLSDD